MTCRVTCNDSQPSNRFTYVRYDSIAQHKQEVFKNLFTQVERFADEVLPNGRSKSLLMTSLEEAYMWTGKSIRDDQIDRTKDAQECKERGEACH